MKYWLYFAAKLAAVGGLLWAVWIGMNRLLPEPQTFLRYRVSRFPQDLPWTTAIFIYGLFAIGLIFLAVWDQRRRCRVCLRRLRMPVEHGSWSEATLFSPPRVESICPYGHGTWKEPEVHTSGAIHPEWRTNGDIWSELEQADRGSR